MVNKSKNKSGKCRTNNMSPQSTPGLVPKPVAAAICRIVDQYLDEERMDYERMPDHIRRDHLYLDFELTNDWLIWLSGRVP